MKTTLILLNITTLLALTAAWLLGQGGPLDPPPGAPSSNVYKTLDEVEARTPISAAGTVISTPGSYYLTGNITGASGQNGIEIQASDITLDLNGFTLTGVAGSLSGIKTTGNRRGIVIRNGHLVSWEQHGIDASSGNRNRFYDLVCRENTVSGLHAGNTATVTECTFADNGETGLIVDAICFIYDNHVVSNGDLVPAATGAGIRTIRFGNHIERNSIVANTRGLVTGDQGNFIIHNAFSGQSNGNIHVTGSNTVGAEVGMQNPLTNTKPDANFTY